VKRVIGLPGDVVSAHGGHVYVNGKQLKEPYLPPGTIQNDFLPKKIPKGNLWVMGDNRNASEDSRIFGSIKESSVVGRVFVRIWPLNRLRFF
jgi:signal peptidase I